MSTWKNLSLGALALLSWVLIAASPYTTLSHLEILPVSWQGSSTKALLVKNTSGTETFSISQSGAVAIQGVITLGNSETIDNATDDMIEFQGAGGADNTDLRFDLDGTRPEIESPTDSSILVDEDLACTGDLTVTGNDIAFGNSETISNTTDDIIRFAGVGGTNNVSLDLDLDANGAGGAVVISSSTSTEIRIVENLGLASGDQITNAVADTITLQCAGACADATDLSVDVDGTRPVISSTTDTEVEVSDALIASGGMTLTCTGCLSALNIADATQEISIPLLSWRTSAAAAPLAIVAGTTPNTATEGSFEVIEWVAGENTQKIELTVRVPSNYVSGMSLILTTINDAADASPDDTFSLTWYVAKSGEADNPVANDECGAGCAPSSEPDTLLDTTIALDAAAIEAGDTLRILFGFSTIDETINLASTALSYVAAQ